MMDASEIRPAMALLEQWEKLNRHQLQMLNRGVDHLYANFPDRQFGDSVDVKLPTRLVVQSLRDEMQAIGIKLIRLGVSAPWPSEPPEPEEAAPAEAVIIAGSGA